MPLNPGVYCAIDDLLKGDLELPRYMGDGSQLVNRGAEDIDSHIGHIYVTPIEIDPAPENRPATLMLKRINVCLSSGRMILDLAAAGEDTSLHQYGRSLVQEAMGLLDKIASGEIVLRGAERIDDVLDPEGGQFTGPKINNEDAYSLVQSFYDRFNPTLGQPCLPFNEAYGGTR